MTHLADDELLKRKPLLWDRRILKRWLLRLSVSEILQRVEACRKCYVAPRRVKEMRMLIWKTYISSRRNPVIMKLRCLE